MANRFEAESHTNRNNIQEMLCVCEYILHHRHVSPNRAADRIWSSIQCIERKKIFVLQMHLSLRLIGLLAFMTRFFSRCRFIFTFLPRSSDWGEYIAWKDETQQRVWQFPLCSKQKCTTNWFESIFCKCVGVCVCLPVSVFPTDHFSFLSIRICGSHLLSLIEQVPGTVSISNVCCCAVHNTHSHSLLSIDTGVFT